MLCGANQEPKPSAAKQHVIIRFIETCSDAPHEQKVVEAIDLRGTQKVFG
jgi:hypothetical protein